MSINDPIADMPSSSLKVEVLKILKREGYIKNFVTRKRKTFNVLKVYMKYTESGECAFESIQRTSTPGRRVYVDKKNIPLVAGGYGTAVISSSRGLLTSQEAYKRGIGGEVLCQIY